MLFYKDPDWYLTNQDKPDKLYSNLIFLLISVYYVKYKPNKELSLLFLLLFIGSSLFHCKTSKNTLMLDRIAMVLLFSYFFNIFYKKISYYIYTIIGLMTLIYWYQTENLIYFFLFQAFGIILFLRFYPLTIIKKISLISIYILFTYIQIIDRGKYHSIKHIILPLLSLYLV